MSCCSGHFCSNVPWRTWLLSLKTCASRAKSMNSKISKGLIGAAVLGALVLLAPMAKQSKEFVNCVKNSEDAIVKLTGVEFLDKDGKPGFLERPVAVHYCNGGDITNFLTLSALSD